VPSTSLSFSNLFKISMALFLRALDQNNANNFMRRKIQFMRGGALVAVLLTFFLMTACKDDDDPSTNNNVKTYTLSGNANGSQMVPSVAGTGTGTFSGTYNPQTRVMTYTTNWNGLTGAPTSGGFYGGASGSNGTAIGSAWTIPSGATETGTMNGTMTLTADQAAQLTGGNMYYTMGTATNPNGEMRGQITATQSGSSQ
jgi:hypothetical protein